MTTGLEGSFSGMRLQGNCPSVSNRQPQNSQMTVRYMTAAEQQDIAARIENLKTAEAKLADARQKIAEGGAMIAQAKAGQAEARKEIETGRSQKEQGKTQIDQAKANLAVLNGQTIKALDGIAGALLKMQEANKQNPAAVQRIDSLRQQVLQYKDNLPTDAAAQQKRMQELKQEATILVQSLAAKK